MYFVDFITMSTEKSLNIEELTYGEKTAGEHICPGFQQLLLLPVSWPGLHRPERSVAFFIMLETNRELKSFVLI